MMSWEESAIRIGSFVNEQANRNTPWHRRRAQWMHLEYAEMAGRELKSACAERGPA